VVELEEPGESVGGSSNGRVFIEWYDRRDPDDLIGPRPSVIYDFFDTTTNIGFPYTGTWDTWIVPPGVDRATFELWGGPGESGAPHGHVLAGYRVAPGDAFSISVGGPGEDTTLRYAGGWPAVAAMAAGGDSERPNYVFPPASPAESFFEGGGDGSNAGDGYAIVHLSPPLKQISEPPAPLEQITEPPTEPPACVVPNLRGKRPRAARKLLRHAHCTLGSVTRRPSRAKLHGRVVKQALPARSQVVAGSPVGITVGKRP
jgi:hypothetical protein